MRSHFVRRLAVAVPAMLLGLLAAAPAAPALAAPALAGPALAGPALAGRALAGRALLGSALAGPAERDETLRVMPLGDSITWGVGSNHQDGYRASLYQRLTAAGLDVDFVGSMHNGRGADSNHEGHKFWTITQLTERIDDWLATYQPDVILLHIGTNDMVRDLPDAPLHLSDLLDRIAADRPGAEVFVAKLVGLGDYRNVEDQQRRTDAFNRSAEDVVASHGDRFHLVDQSSVHGIGMRNREHPNDYGYAEMAWNWYRAMGPVLNPDGPPWPATANPYRAATSYRCVDASTLDPAAAGCHVWYHRRLSRTASRRVWQLPVREWVRENGKPVAHVRWVTAP
jgi:lysophospholipase L1-like esterase